MARSGCGTLHYYGGGKRPFQIAKVALRTYRSPVDLGCPEEFAPEDGLSEPFTTPTLAPINEPQFYAAPGCARSTRGRAPPREGVLHPPPSLPRPRHL